MNTTFVSVQCGRGMTEVENYCPYTGREGGFVHSVAWYEPGR